jgi:hypothetical protein
MLQNHLAKVSSSEKIRNLNNNILGLTTSQSELHKVSELAWENAMKFIKRVTRILINMSHNGNFIPTRAQGGNKKIIDNIHK